MDTQEERKYDPNIQHGIDDDANGDAEKGATIGGIGGAVTGLAAGSLAGPVGAVIGAVIGGIAGAAASGVAVAAIDRVDNDNTISGLGDGVTYKDAPTYYSDENGAQYYFDEEDRRIYTDETGRYYYTDIVTGERSYVNDDMQPATRFYTDSAGNAVGNGLPGVQTGGYATDGTPDTRGVMEKIADTATGDDYDDKTGKPIANTNNWNDEPVGNGIPGVQTGGHTIDGTPDTRGISEKVADAVTGDNWDDKTGKPVDNNTNWNTNKSWDIDNNAPVGNGIPGIQTGGHDIDGTPDTRGILEKTADALTGDNLDDKTGKPVANDDNNFRVSTNDPSFNGRTLDGSTDTRGAGEKVADAVTGDKYDDKTGKKVAY